MARYLTFFLSCVIVCGSCRRETPSLVLATTTSVANSGLLDTLLPAFQTHTGQRVRSLPVGSGRALRLLAEGHADVVISHAPAQEADALRAHGDWWYRKVFFNDFLIVGPADDPAGIRDAANAMDALRRIARSQTQFVSRGDESGTYEREQALWRDIGIGMPAGRLIVAGQGMGGTLRIASEMAAYTLTDRGTFEQLAPNLKVVELYHGDNGLLNTYAVISPSVASRGQTFASWLADGGGRETLARAIASGQQRGFLLWPAGKPRERPKDIP